MRHNKSALAFCIFLFAGVAGLVSDLGLGAWLGWKDAHTLSHFCFGLGFPLLWVAICSAKRKANRKAWQIAFDDKVMRRLGDGFWLGVAITAGWSLWNEIIVYQVYNPSHPADWHHWFADHAGLITAYTVFQAITRRSTAAFHSG
jgi:hypothetical protein